MSLREGREQPMIFCAALTTRSVRLGAAAVPYFDTVCWQAFFGGGGLKVFFLLFPVLVFRSV